jgi:DNA repair protein RecO (recombination protein O)
MRPQRAEAIVLQTMPVRERDKLVVLLTPDRGKLRAWAYGARSIKSRYGAAFEPLTRLRIIFTEKETDETVRIESAELVRSLFNVQQDLRSSVAGSYIAETADVFVQANEASELVFRLVDRCCQALAERLEPVALVAYFEIWMLRLTGVFPSLHDCMSCHGELGAPYRFDESLAGFVCESCSHTTSEIVPNELIQQLYRIQKMTVEEWVGQSLSPAVLFDIRLIARRVRRHFLGHELKSHDILQAVI